MFPYILALVTSGIAAFILGWRYRVWKDKDTLITATLVIANLKATIEIYKSTIRQQEAYVSRKYTDMKLEQAKIREENDILKEIIIELEKDIEKLTI